ncbi:MAG: PRC-barrel domain-containing protein [Solirubrobacterales bacterium]
MDLGAPISYLTLSEGSPVFAQDGSELGKVAEVVAAPEQDIFEGLVVSSGLLGGGRHFVEASRVASLHERGVVLGIEPEAFSALPERLGGA